MGGGGSVFIVLALLFGCHRDFPATCEDAAAYTPEATIGTGNEAFEPVTEGQEVALTWGNQGGQHVWGSVRARGILAPKRLGETSPIVDFTVTREQDVLAQVNWEMVFEDAGDGWVERVGEPVQFGWDTGGEEEPLSGSAVTLAVSITDTCGTTVEDSVGIVLK